MFLGKICHLFRSCTDKPTPSPTVQPTIEPSTNGNSSNIPDLSASIEPIMKATTEDDTKWTIILYIRYQSVNGTMNSSVR